MNIIKNYKLSFDITNLKGEQIKIKVREKKISLIKIKLREIVNQNKKEHNVN
jgi:hypothetical protein